MRLALVALGLALLVPEPVIAQAYRASVLYTAEIASGAPGLGLDLAWNLQDDSLSTDSTTTAPAARPPVLHAPDVPTLRAQPPLVQPIAVGVVSAFAGAYGGALIGESVDRYDTSEFFPVGPLIGYFVGETVALPIGVHLGNARHGNLLGDLGISLLGHLGAIGFASLGGGGAYVVGLAGQVAMTVANERATAKRRLRAEGARNHEP